MFKCINIPFNVSIKVTIISWGISYFLFFIAALLVTPIGYQLDTHLDTQTSDTIAMFLIGIFQILFCFFLFKLKRFKKGMTFLSDKTPSNTGLSFSFSILITSAFLAVYKNPSPLLIIPLLYTLISGLSIIVWWKSNLTKSYINKITSQEISEQKQIIIEQNKNIENLKQHNYELSKIIHRDNKLLPTLIHTTQEFLILFKSSSSKELLMENSSNLLRQLEQISEERLKIINNYEFKTKNFPLTNLFSIDTLINYMYQKACANSINYNVSIQGNAMHFTTYFIKESDLRIIIAELIQNAIIAVNNLSKKYILINFSCQNHNYIIEILDSAALFHDSVLLNLGITPYTTHQDAGGSGIGLFDSIDILKMYHASFEIEELYNPTIYTKKIKLCFDNLSQIRIKTYRKNITSIMSSRNDIIIL
ncbi:MAG TPA: GHKL domain-containing protein [Sedimentibacter sp.]|nr:GHKL domain-containing protein [Sedimentibacter sp.]